MNQQAMLRKIKQLQKEMLDAQKEVDESEFSATSGPITLVMLGTKVIKEINVDRNFKFEDSDDYEMLEDALVALSRQLSEEIDEYRAEKMEKYSSMLGGMGGLF